MRVETTTRLAIAILCALGFSLLGYSSAQARLGHGGGATPTQCASKPVDGNCAAGVLAGGIYYGAGTPGAASFLSMIAQSGQTYTTDVTFNRCGVEYGCGPNKLDSAMTDVTTITNGQFTGCGAYNASSSPNPTWSCTYTTSTPVNIDSVWVHDTTLNITNNGGAHVKLSNVTFQTGPNMCLANSTAAVNFLGSSSDIEVDNFKLIDDPVCNGAAELWGTPAATGLGLQQTAAFTASFAAGSRASPGIMQIGTGTTGTMYRKSFVNWPGRAFGTCCSGPFTQINQLLWFAQWIGTGHTSGTTFTVDSTDASSPAANPTANTWLTWNSSSTLALQGDFVTNCTVGSPTTCQLSASPSLSSGTAVATGERSCAGSACDNGIWLMQLALTGIGPVSMTTGPMYSVGAELNIGQTACNTFKARYGYIVREPGYFISKGNCAIDSESNYTEEMAGELGFINGGGVPHIETISEEPLTGSTQNISQYTQEYEVAWVNKWAFPGTVTAQFNMFTNGSGGNYQTTWNNALIAYDMAVLNKAVNNAYDDGGYSTPTTGYQVRTTGQGFGNTLAQFSATETSNGNGTGTMHVSAVASGTIAVGQYLSCDNTSGCASYPAGPMQVTAQIATQGGDVSTWTVSQDLPITHTVTAGLYPGYIVTNNWNHLWFDTIGTNGGALVQDINVLYGTSSCSNAVTLTTGGPYC